MYFEVFLEPNQFTKLINVQVRSEGEKKDSISQSKQRDEKTSLNKLNKPDF